MQEHIQSLKGRAETVLEQLANRTEEAEQLADSLLEELKETLRTAPRAGEVLGPLVTRLRAARKARPSADSLRWVAVGNGHLAIGHRPKMKAIPELRLQGATHVLTLLSETEGAADIGAAVKKAGMVWFWFPLVSAVPPGEERDADVRHLYEMARAALEAGGKIYIHCSAGIHRTGMITCGLLRSTGLSRNDALAVLHSLRTETGEGVGEDRLAWGDRFGVVNENLSEE